MRIANSLLMSMTGACLLVWQTASLGAEPTSDGPVLIPIAAKDVPPAVPVAEPPPETEFATGRGSAPAVLPPPITMDLTPAPASPSEPAVEEAPAPAKCGPVIWGSIEALTWRVKSSPVVPLVTTNPDPNAIASLAEPGTKVLFGGAGNPIAFGDLDGVRGTIGGWFPEQPLGIEGSGFGLPTQTKIFNAVSRGADSPVIAVPLTSTVGFNGNPAGETSLNPGNVPSLIRVTATTELWGAEALGLYNLYSCDWVRVALQAGFQYLSLDEGLSLNQVFYDTAGVGALTIRDQVYASNHFYGAVAGAQAGFGSGPLGFDVTGKLALGPSQQKYSIFGTSTATGTAFGLPAGTAPSGLFALPSNSGAFSRNNFLVVPQFQARLTLDVVHNLRLFVAYDYLHMNNVLRAGTQIDPNINPTQNTIFGPPTGLAAPLPVFSRTDFWAQGFSAGVQIQF